MCAPRESLLIKRVLKDISTILNVCPLLGLKNNQLKNYIDEKNRNLSTGYLIILRVSYSFSSDNRGYVRKFLICRQRIQIFMMT